MDKELKVPFGVVTECYVIKRDCVYENIFKVGYVTEHQVFWSTGYFENRSVITEDSIDYVVIPHNINSFSFVKQAIRKYEETGVTDLLDIIWEKPRFKKLLVPSNFVIFSHKDKLLLGRVDEYDDIIVLSHTENNEDDAIYSNRLFDNGCDETYDIRIECVFTTKGDMSAPTSITNEFIKNILNINDDSKYPNVSILWKRDEWRR